MPTLAGVDFGTNSIKAAYSAGAAGAISLALNDEEMFMPALVHVDGREVTVGREAFLCCRSEFQNVAGLLRRRIGNLSDELRLGGRTFAESDLIVNLLSKVLKTVHERLAGVEGWAISVPSGFGPNELKALIQLLGQMGHAPVALVREPAALIASSEFQQARSTKICLNLGAGSLDLAVCSPASSDRSPWHRSDSTLGGAEVRDRLLKNLAEKVIQVLRIDPREHPVADQVLFQGVERALRGWKPSHGADLDVDLMGRRFACTISPADLESAGVRVMSWLSDVLHELSQENELPQENDIEVLATGELSRLLPWEGVITDILGSGIQTTLCPLDAVALGTAWWAQQLKTNSLASGHCDSVCNACGHSSRISTPCAQCGNQQMTRLVERPWVENRGEQGAQVAQLILLDSKSERKAIAKSVFRIGRNPLADWVFDGEQYSMISGAHCVVEESGGRFYLKDLGSSNGTFIGERQIERERLRNGDVFRLGKSGPAVRFVLE